MSAVCMDTSAAGLCRVSQDHVIESLTSFSAVPDVEVEINPELIRICSPGIPNGLTNTVLRCRLTPETADQLIDATSAYFQARGVAPCWRLCPDDLPADLQARLVQHGYTLKEEQYAMALDLSGLNESSQLPDGLLIARVPDAATLREQHISLRRLGAGKTLGALLLDLFCAHGFDTDSAWQHYIGLLNGRPVACASIFYALGAAGVYMVSTLPEARRQGIGRALTQHALLDARARGYHVAVLQSTSMGFGVYRELGFKPCFNIKFYAPA